VNVVKKVEELLVTQANKISELYSNKEIIEEFKSEAMSVMKERFDHLFEEMLSRVNA
jgi:hypothetical protein